MPDSDPDLSRLRLIREGNLTDADWEEVSRCRGQHNRLGFAYQVAFVRILGRFPTQVPFEIDGEILRFTALQLKVSPEIIDTYADRQPTLSEHQQRIRDYLHLQNFDSEAEERLVQFLEHEALRIDRTASLLARSRAWLQEQHLLSPADYLLRRSVGSARQKARETMTHRMMKQLTSEARHQLDTLLTVDDQEVYSALHSIKANSPKASVSAMKHHLERIGLIESTGLLEIDISWINGNYQRSLFHSVRIASANRLKQMPAPRRYLALVCYLHQAWRDTLDQAVDMYGKLLERSQKQVAHHLDEKLKDQRRTVDRIVQRYKVLGSVLLDPEVSDAKLREHLLSVVSREHLQEDQSDLAGWTRGDRKARFEALADRHTGIGRFAGPFLTRLSFLDEQSSGSSPTMNALRLYRDHKASGRRSLPDDTPVDFAPESLRSLIQSEGTVDRKRWESALFLKVRDEIRAGNLAIDGAKNFGRFEAFFLPVDQWQSTREQFWQSTGLPADPKLATGLLKERLTLAFDQFMVSLDANTHVNFDESGWRLKKDPAESLSSETDQQLVEMRRWLDDHTRQIRLADLLIEVENDLGFSTHFRTTGKQSNDPDEVCSLIATLLAHGCNLGLHTMAKIAPGIGYKKLKRISDWYLAPENQRAALARIVHGMSRIDITTHWGEGKSSSSDGQRFAMPNKVLQQTYSTRFNDFALEFYSFIADNYAPFYSRPIECTDRDAPFVLDGVLYNESDLDLEEHYTDTHGYTEINFAAFAMIGKRFCPRIRNLHKQRIYCADPKRDHGPLESVLKRGRRSINFKLIEQHWERIGQFYAAFPAGHTTASAALQRLNRFQASNRFYAANRELGRTLKTEFLLQYMSEPQLRTKIRRGLLKVEQLHGLARAVYYGQRGRITAREIYDQMNACSCLTLILACIIYWQAREISRVASRKDFPFDPSLIQYISPIEWKNVILYGEIKIDPKKLKPRNP